MVRLLNYGFAFFSLALLSTNSYSSEVSIPALGNTPTAKTLQQTYRMTYKELESINKISIDSIDKLSLIFNSVDKTNSKSEMNFLIKDKLSKSNLHTMNMLIEFYFNDFSSLSKYRFIPRSVRISSRQNGYVGDDKFNKDFKEIFNLRKNISSLGFQQIFNKAFRNLFKTRIDIFNKMQEKLKTPEVISLFNSKPDLRNRRFILSPALRANEQIASVFRPLDILIDLDKTNFLNELYNNFIIDQIISYVIDEDLVLQSKVLPFRADSKIIWNGSYSIKSSNCTNVSYPISNSTEVLSGHYNTCDPGNYSRNGRASSLPFLKTKKTETTMAFELEVTGGYACENYLGRPRNCRDYTSTASVDIVGKKEINKCNDLYKCNILRSFNINYSGDPDRNIKLLVDGEVSNLSSGYIFATKDTSLGMKVKKSISHTGGGGSAKSTAHAFLTVKPGDNSTIHYSELRIDYPLFNKLRPSSYSAVSIHNAFVNITDSSKYGLSEISNSLVAHKNATNENAAYGINEAALLYNLLSKRKLLKSLPTPYKDVYKTAQHSVSNRLREFRLPAVEAKAKAIYRQIINQYVNTPTIKILESFINDERNLELNFSENVDIINALLPGHSFEGIKTEVKLSILESLYEANIQNRDKLIQTLEKHILELSLYRDTSEDERELNEIKGLM